MAPRSSAASASARAAMAPTGSASGGPPAGAKSTEREATGKAPNPSARAARPGPGPRCRPGRPGRAPGTRPGAGGRAGGGHRPEALAPPPPPARTGRWGHRARPQQVQARRHHLGQGGLPRVLQGCGAGVGGAHQHEETAAMGPAGGQEGLEGVQAQVGAHRERVGGEGGVGHQVGAGIGRCGAADVAPLGVGDHQQARGAGVGADGLEGGHAWGAQLLEEGNLGLDRRHPTGDGFDHLGPEAAHLGGGQDAKGRARQAVPPGLDHRGNTVQVRIQADGQGHVHAPAGLGQALSKGDHGATPRGPPRRGPPGPADPDASHNCRWSPVSG